MCACMLGHFSHVKLFAIPWTVARQAPLSRGFSRQEYWSGLPCPLPGDLPNPGIEPASLMPPVLAGRFFTTESHLGSPHICVYICIIWATKPHICVYICIIWAIKPHICVYICIIWAIKPHICIYLCFSKYESQTIKIYLQLRNRHKEIIL